MIDDQQHDERRALVMRVALLADRVRLDQAELAAALHSAYAQGTSLRSLARAAGVSHEQVRRIVHHQRAEMRAQESSHRVTI